MGVWNEMGRWFLSTLNSANLGITQSRATLQSNLSAKITDGRSERHKLADFCQSECNWKVFIGEAGAA